MKKLLALVLALAMIFALCACGSKQNATVNVDKESEGKVTVGAGIANPMHAATQESILADLGITFQVPAGAEDVKFYTIDTEPKTAQMSFVFDGDEYTYRIAPASEFTDISGMYFDWEETEETQISYCDAKVCWNDWKEGVILWYDAVPGLMYSLAQGANANYNSLEGMASILFEPVQGDADGDEEAEETEFVAVTPDDFNEAFTGLVNEIHEYMEMGTAGASLKSAAFAARVMDMLVEDKPAVEDVAAAVKAYAESLDAKGLEAFKEQMAQLKSSAEALNNGSSGQTLLESCGYEALHAPWDAKTMVKYFDAMQIA